MCPVLWQMSCIRQLNTSKLLHIKCLSLTFNKNVVFYSKTCRSLEWHSHTIVQHPVGNGSLMSPQALLRSHYQRIWMHKNDNMLTHFFHLSALFLLMLALEVFSPVGKPVSGSFQTLKRFVGLRAGVVSSFDL